MSAADDVGERSARCGRCAAWSTRWSWCCAPRVDHAVHELALPLSDTGVIREQAAAKHLDPALIAAVIYAETKFDPRTSSAGAEGLMQIEPATAEFLARLSGGYGLRRATSATPAINVAYGSYYLRYLLDHYGGDEMLAVAAYNAGLANVDRWVAQARRRRPRADRRRDPFLSDARVRAAGVAGAAGIPGAVWASAGAGMTLMIDDGCAPGRHMCRPAGRCMHRPGEPRMRGSRAAAAPPTTAHAPWSTA